MKPLYHPSANDITVEGVMHALADPVRVHIYADIAKSECPKICSAFLGMGERPMPKSTLSQHFKILREAGLIRSENGDLLSLRTLVKRQIFRITHLRP
jgi:DNA-binding transcriptional ArsR family regulator